VNKTVLGILLTTALIPTLGIPLTLHFQLVGTLFTFFLSGLIGGYLAGLDKLSRLRGFVTGILGSVLYLVAGICIVLLIITYSLEDVDLLRYLGNYTLWLFVASPMNIIPLVVLLAGLGGTIGVVVVERK